MIAVSHEGATTATNAALAAARAAGARTALITVTRRSPGAALADLVVETEELDQGWCHTVGYLSPLLAGAAVGAHLSGRAVDAAAASAVLAAGAADHGRRRTGRRAIRRTRPTSWSSPRARIERPGRELVLKIEEGSWIPSAYRDLETFLHGHLPATGPDAGLVLILADRDERDRATRPSPRRVAGRPRRRDAGRGDPRGEPRRCASTRD